MQHTPWAPRAWMPFSWRLPPGPPPPPLLAALLPPSSWPLPLAAAPAAPVQAQGKHLGAASCTEQVTGVVWLPLTAKRTRWQQCPMQPLLGAPGLPASGHASPWGWHGHPSTHRPAGVCSGPCGLRLRCTPGHKQVYPGHTPTNNQAAAACRTLAFTAASAAAFLAPTLRSRASCTFSFTPPFDILPCTGDCNPSDNLGWVIAAGVLMGRRQAPSVHHRRRRPCAGRLACCTQLNCLHCHQRT